MTDTRPRTVYILQGPDWIKIGSTVDLPNRLWAYPRRLRARLIGLIPGSTLAVERQLQQRFRVHLKRGREWFHVAPEILEAVALLRPPGVDWLRDENGAWNPNALPRLIDSAPKAA